MMARVLKGDTVYILSGKDKGRTGKVLRVFPKTGQCLVEKVAMVKRHQKAKPTGGPSGIVEKGMKIDLCKVAPIDPKSDKPTRVRIQVKDGKKIRTASGSKQELERSSAA